MQVKLYDLIDCIYKVYVLLAYWYDMLSYPAPRGADWGVSPEPHNFIYISLVYLSFV